MKRIALAFLVIAVASGCQQAPFNTQKGEAQQRWFETRSKVLYRLAEDRFRAGQLDAASQSVHQALALEPACLESNILLAKIDIERGQYAVAAEGLTKLLAAHPQSSEAAYLLGVAQEKAHKLREALASYRRAYALDEANLSAVKAAGEILVAMGEVRQAQLYVESFLPKAGEDAGMYELAGRLAMMGHEYDKAVESCQRARDLDGRNLRYMEALARAQFAATRYADAAESLADVIAHQPDKSSSWAHLMLGDAQMGLGKARQAFEAYFTAAERAPDDPGAWVCLAHSALAIQDAPRAILAARKALTIEPQHVQATIVLGYALLRDNQPAEALKTLSRAAEAHADNGTIQCLLGRAYAANGQPAQALRCYSQAVKMDPSSRLARELLAAAGGVQVSKAD
jgi:tetratricopeptide (TPR) repeat protein